ncbi:MAG: hypothetical protein JWM74_3013 [Myxococcaceae bacterium]|jgi:hypothetical protein|nr:hypothetical protein [Myxococcaceae bacterium]
MFRKLLVSLVALPLTFVAVPALACGTEGAISPVTVRPTNDTASVLLAEARQLEARASNMDVRASEMDRRASDQAIEARALRIEAASIEGRERLQVLALADSMTAQASSSRLQARQLRDQAVQLRTLARSDRERALRLVGGGGGGWRGRGDTRLPSTSI